MHCAFTVSYSMSTLCPGEVTRMKLANKMLQKHERADQERKARVINGIRKRVEELHAYQNVLTSFK